MYYTAAGGVAGGVVVGYLASDSALGLLSLMRLMSHLRKTFVLVVVQQNDLVDTILICRTNLLSRIATGCNVL
jgi:hypothetical protein